MSKSTPSPCGLYVVSVSLGEEQELHGMVLLKWTMVTKVLAAQQLLYL